LEIVRNFFQDYAANWWLQGPIPNKSDPDPDPKPDPIPSPKLSAACWSENRTIVLNFDQDAAASGDLCCAGCCFPGLQLPNTEQLLPVMDTWNAVKVFPWRIWLKTEQLFAPEARQIQAPNKEKPQTLEATGVFTEQIKGSSLKPSPSSGSLVSDQLVCKHLSRPKQDDLHQDRNPCTLVICYRSNV
jgi:hypothetical protein